MSRNTIRIVPFAVLFLLAAAAPALGQSRVVSTVILRPSADDRAVTGVHVSVNFGAAVALSGNTAAIGIPHEVEDQPFGPGRVGIYSRTQEGWTRTATLLPSNPNDIRLGRDVDLCGDLAIAAAENSTYVFQRRGAQWREVKRIELPSPDSVLGPVVCSGDSFAQSVSQRDDQGQLIAGQVHVYQRTRSGDFELVAKLRASDPNDRIGRSLAMERGIVVTGSEPDAVYVFVRHHGRWVERQKLQSPAVAGGDFGAAVAIGDRIIIVGAPGVDLPEEFLSDGDAFVYLPHRQNWFESQSLNAPLPELAPSAQFGSKVAMGRRLAAVAVPITTADEIRPTSVVTMFERIGVEFTPAHTGFGAGPDDQTIPDFDISGPRLIVSEHESLRLNGQIIGRVLILEFGPSPEPATQIDAEEGQ
jgi:hypothetical protein